MGCSWLGRDSVQGHVQHNWSDGVDELEPAVDMYGPVVISDASLWYLGATQGSNQTGELSGIMTALLWLLEFPGSDTTDVVICSDSIYAMNQLDERWRVNMNEWLIQAGRQLLARVQQQWVVAFCHVKGHQNDVGNERADELVQWGKISGPFS